MPPMPTIPRQLYGTAWKQERTSALVVQAILAGFKGIDTACQPKHYRQDLVGSALRILQEQHGVEREQLWLQTKFTALEGQDRGKPLPYDAKANLDEQVRQSFETSLKELGTTYLDSLVLHSPLSTREETAIVWKEFEKLVDAGKVRQIGISNIYDVALLEWCFVTFRIPPSIIQNRFNKEHNAFALPILSLCASQPHPVTFQPFWTLTSNPWIHRSPLILTLADATGLTVEAAWHWFLMSSRRWPRVRWCVLNGTTREEHMKLGMEACEKAEEEWDEVVQKAVANLEARLWG